MSNIIRLTGFKLFGHALFEDGTFFTVQTDGLPARQYQSRTVQFNARLRLNRDIGVVGRNATGKSTLLRIFKGLNDFYLGQQSIDKTVLQRALWSDKGVIAVTAYLATDDTQWYVVKTRFVQQRRQGALDAEETIEWVVASEEVYAKSTTDETPPTLVGSSQNRHLPRMKQLVNRTQLSSDGQRLLDTQNSVFRVIVPDTQPLPMLYVGETTVSSVKLFGDQVPTELLTYVDDSIANLFFARDDAGCIQSYHLTFHSGQEAVVTRFSELKRYLSAGTLRSIVLFYACLNVLKNGATLLVDDIGRQLDRQLARDFVGFFSDATLNVNGGTIVFSTHEAPLLDDLKREDELFVLTRDTQVSVLRLSDNRLLDETTERPVRKQVRGTAPDYCEYMKLKALVEKLNQQSK